MLLEHGADPELASGTRQVTPLTLAEESGESKLVTLLREAVRK